MVGVTELRKREVAIFLSQLALYLCRFDSPSINQGSERSIRA
jgi:hypothetical protein